jgi:hypothetical protein
LPAQPRASLIVYFDVAATGLRASNKINERPSKRDCEAFFDFVEELSGETMLLWIAGKTLFVWS